MKKFLVSILVLITIQVSAQPYFTINSPTPNQVVAGNTLYISGAVFGGGLVTSVVAYTYNRADTLTLSAPDPDYPFGYYQTFYKSIPVAGLPLGVPLQLKLTATTTGGSQASDSVYYSITPPYPQAFILQPTAGTSAYPSLHVKTNHTGTDTCTSYLSVKINGNVTFTDTSVYNDIDTTFSLSNYPSGSVRVVLAVKDKWNHYGRDSIDIFSDSFLYMMPFYTGRGVIKDYNYHQVAEVIDAANDSLYLTMDSNLQVHKLVPNPYRNSYTNVYCTPYGVICDGVTSAREFTNDSLYALGGFSSTAGKYLTYSERFTGGTLQPEPFPGTRVMLKNMETQNLSRIDVQYGDGEFSDPMVAEDGTVVYGAPTLKKILKFNGDTAPARVTIAETADENSFLVGQITDGKNVLFLLKSTDPAWPGAHLYKLLWHNGTSVDTLSDLGFYSPSLTASYTVSNGFIAYQKAVFGMQVFLRDTSGVTTQLTTGTDSKSINGLNAYGDIIYTTSNGIFYLKHGAASPRRIYFNGTLLSRDREWYVINGKYLYKLNVGAFRTVANGNWTNAASWENGLVPTPGADVIVTTNIVVNTNVVCNSIRVVPPGSITVAPGVTLTVLH